MVFTYFINLFIRHQDLNVSRPPGEKTNKNNTVILENSMCILSTGPIHVLGVNKTIFTSKKAEICIFYNSGTIIVIKK